MLSSGVKRLIIDGKKFTAGATLDASTLAWVAAVNAAAGGSVVGATRKTLVNNLILGLKADSLFSVIDGLWVHCFADENSNEALIDIVNLSVATQNGSGTLTANGWTGDASTGYLQTTIAPGGGNLTTGLGSLASYVLNARSASAGKVSIGAENAGPGGGAFTYIDPFDAGAFNFEVFGGSFPSVAASNSRGLWVVSRQNTIEAHVYLNGVEAGSSPITESQHTVTSAFTLVIGATNNLGTVASFSDDNIGVSVILGPVTPTQALNLSTRINTCMANLPTPKNVY